MYEFDSSYICIMSRNVTEIRTNDDGEVHIWLDISSVLIWVKHEYFANMKAFRNFVNQFDGRDVLDARLNG